MATNPTNGVHGNRENLGPAERIIQMLLSYSDHAVHNRPGVVVPDPSNVVGVRWAPVTHKVEGDPAQKVVYRCDKVGKKETRVRLGVMIDEATPNGGHVIFDGPRVVGEYRPAALFPEVVAWVYRQVAEVWKLDNEFAARWGSYAFGQEHRDLKVILAAFLLVQSRKGDPVLDEGRVIFHDEDYRDVGEAMLLLTRKDGKDLNAKLLLRVREVLRMPAVAAINRELGFAKSARNPFYGRWVKAVDKWLRYREHNPRMLEGLVKSGQRSAVIELAERAGYKPTTERFFEVLRWKQEQAADGRRRMAIGLSVARAEMWAWEKLTEREVCEKIIAEKLDMKRLVSLVPKSVGFTRAVMAAAIEAGALSDKDLIIYSATLEELGLLDDADVRARWEKAVKTAEDARAANIAARVKSTAVKEKLAEATDNAAKKAVAEVVRAMRIYFLVDASGSMEGSIAAAKRYIAQFLPAFPLDQIHVAVFNTAAREIQIRHASAAGVEQAFRGVTASGGTAHRTAIEVLRRNPPSADEDSLLIVVGDGGENGSFAPELRLSGLRPMAIGFLRVPGQHGDIVEYTARDFGVPLLMIDERIFADPYAIGRTIRNLVASTPVGAGARAAAKRESLVEVILKTPLLQLPPWTAWIGGGDKPEARA
jgi:hypothetical protein